MKKLIINPENKFILHALNLNEVYYDFLKRSGKGDADNFLEDCKNLPIDIIWHTDDEIIKLSSLYKTKYRISLADSYFLAITEINKAIPISTDHHEFDVIEKDKNIQFYWLR